MSLIRDPAIITKVGRQMMTAGGDITYTKATLYGQDISHLTKDQLESLTSIGNPLMTVPVGISDKSDNGNGTTIVLEATFQNTNLKTDLPYTAVGFFAKKGEDEKLIIVGVANAGAYLAATRPDGVATDALDLKVAIAIGDATNVTAVVDPAASVTPATLNGAINETKQVLTALIDTKASQSNLDQTNAEVAKKADSEAVNSQLATKANTTDIDKQVKTLNDAINTKADKATVDAEIAKIDFTPYAKTADVSEQIKAVSDEVATKVGADYSYSKAQLDEKLLALSTDTNGKVSADQVTALIADKANKADVDKQIKDINDAVATKADQATTYSTTDVDKLLSAKDDTTDVDAKIKTVTDLANTKASQDSLNKLSQTVDTKADKSSVDAKINAIDFSKIGFTKQYITNSNGDTDHHTWFAKKQSDGTWTIDITDASNSVDWTAAIARNNKRDIASLQSNKADTSTVNAKIDEAKNIAKDDTDSLKNLVNAIRNFDVASFKGSIPNTDINKITDNGLYGFSNQVLTNSPFSGNNWGLLLVIREYYNDANNIDQFITSGGRLYWRNISLTNNRYSSWKKFASDDDINSLQNQINDRATNSKVNVDGPLFKHLTQFNNWGDLFDGYSVNGFTATNGSRLVAFRDDTNSPNLVGGNSSGIGFGGGDTKGYLSVSYGQHRAIIGGGNGNGPVWSEDIAWKSDINSLLNTITTLQNQVNDLINQINYIKQNYLQGKRFPASQEAQAQQWENANPNGIAMIEK